VFRVLGEPGVNPKKEWSASRSLNDQEPPAQCFGLPEYDGGLICPRIHTVRMRLGYARAQGIL